MEYLIYIRHTLFLFLFLLTLQCQLLFAQGNNLTIFISDTNYIVSVDGSCHGGGIVLKDSIIKKGQIRILGLDSNLIEVRNFKNYLLDGIRQYWYDGKLSSETNFMNGKPNGFSKHYSEDENGNKYVNYLYYYKNGNRLSSSSYYSNGVLASIDTTIDSVNIVKHFHPGGELHYEWTSNDSKMPDRISYKYFASGKIEETSYKKNGKLDSVITLYENGHVAEKRYYNQNGILDWNKKYYENGIMSYEKVFFSDYSGTHCQYYENGKPKEEHKSGPKNQPEYFYQYYENGLPRLKKTFLPDGSIKECKYHPNGKIEVERFYKSKSKLEGVFTKYDSTGIKVSEESYHDGKQNGAFKTWYKNGDIKTVKTFKDNILDGEYLYYSGMLDRTNKLLFTYLQEKKMYSNGFLVFEEEYSTNGIKESYKEYKNGKPNGIWYNYFAGGGYSKAVYEDGKLISLVNYDKMGFVTKKWDVENLEQE